MKIKNHFNKYDWVYVIIGIFLSALSIFLTSYLSTQNVTVDNIPKKELTAILFDSIPIHNSEKFEVFYKNDSSNYEEIYLTCVTIHNTGDKAVNFSDFIEPFVIITGGKITDASISKINHNDSHSYENKIAYKYDDRTFEIEGFFLNPQEYFSIYFLSHNSLGFISYNYRVADLNILNYNDLAYSKIKTVKKIIESNYTTFKSGFQFIIIAFVNFVIIVVLNIILITRRAYKQIIKLLPPD